MKTKIGVALLALALTVSVYTAVRNGGRVNQRIAELEAAVAARDAHIDSLTAHKDSAERNLAVFRDSVQATIREREEYAREAGLAAVRADGRLRGAMGALDLTEQQYAILTAELDSLNAAYRAQIQHKDTIILGLTKVVASQDTALNDYRRLNAELQAQLRDTDELAALWKHEARPSLFGRLTRDLPEKLIVLGFGYAAGKL